MRVLCQIRCDGNVSSGGVWSSEVRVVLLDVKNGLNIDWGCSQRDMPKFPGIIQLPSDETCRDKLSKA